MDKHKMEQAITRLLWKDWYGFFRALHAISEGETQRDVISTELISFWDGIKLATAALPGLPTDY